MTLFVGSQSYISPPSFMFDSAAVSEIRKLNQNKKKKKEKELISNLTPFLGVYNLPIFNQRYLLGTCTHSVC